MVVSCNKPGCSREWETDPVFDVTCPNCGAEPGEKCKRPSGHVVWDTGNSLPRGAHRARDIEALDKGAYGTCPTGRCPASVEELETQPEADEQATFESYA